MPAPAIDPEIGSVLEQIGALLPVLDPPRLAEIRDQRMLLLEGVPLSDEVARRDEVVPGPQGAPDIELRIHTPVGLTGPAACVYSIHGGGYVLGHRSMDDLRFDRWCPRLGFIGVSVEYRLAPETPYPGPLEDCYAGLA